MRAFKASFLAKLGSCTVATLSSSVPPQIVSQVDQPPELLHRGSMSRPRRLRQRHHGVPGANADLLLRASSWRSSLFLLLWGGRMFLQPHSLVWASRRLSQPPRERPARTAPSSSPFSSSALPAAAAALALSSSPGGGVSGGRGDVVSDRRRPHKAAAARDGPGGLLHRPV